MKKTIIILFLFICTNSYCQKKDSATIYEVDTTYRINLSKEEFINLINVIKSLDEKPSIINAWLQQNIYSKTQLIPAMKPKENNSIKKK